MRRNNKLPFFIPTHIFSNVEWVEGDILDMSVLENAMEGMDIVIHSAAKVSFVSNEHQAMLKTNIEGTANVVNASLLKKIKRFVHISSVSALGRTTDGEIINENKQWQESNINTSYAISKYNAEMEVWRGIGEGLNAVIVNPSTILGYGDWNNSSNAIFKNVYNEFPWYTNGINGFVAVEDVAKATVLLMESNINNERFILNADNWPFRQLFNTIADGFDKKHPHRQATPLLAAIALALEKIKTTFSHKPSFLTKESARIAQTKTYFDNSKILKALTGFSFTPLDVSIKKACNQYLQSL
jgi:dihydroflavonol-4-reductase